MASDTHYYRARAMEERDRAATATDPGIANIHRDLAAKYEALAKAAEGQPPLWRDVDDVPDPRPA